MRHFDDERNRAIARRLDELALVYGIPATELSTAVLLASPFPTFPVLGSSSVDQLRSSFRAAEVELSEEDLRAALGTHPPY